LNDSNDVSDAAQLFIFIRAIDNKFSLYVELASISSLHDSTTREDLFMKVKEILSSLRLKWGILQSVKTDGAQVAKLVLLVALSVK
jgi:hypothetical protein